ncbi:MAG: hypothetical protein PHS37_09435, partial [Candidatus Omnitrophica bacterium]|nr:hypothetical protein [Candidatus Omnitrophota bacterium]
MNQGGVTVPLQGHAGKIEIPFNLGTITDSYQGTNGKTVIHIQDAHCNYSCQRSTEGLVDYFNREYNVDTAALEGGAGKYDLSIFTEIKNKALREKVADYFVKEGRVNGTELFAINNPEKITLNGLEEPELYLEDLKIYRDSLKNKDEIDRILNILTRDLSSLKERVYSAKLKEFEGKREGYSDRTVELNAYLGYLLALAKDDTIGLFRQYHNLRKLTGVIEKEKGIDFKNANAERNDLVNELSKRVSQMELEALVNKVIEFKEGRIRQTQFYAYIFKKARASDVDIAGAYPTLAKYKEYIDVYESIDTAALFGEIEKFEDAIAERLFENDSQKELYTRSKELKLLKGLFSITLTREMYDGYVSFCHSSLADGKHQLAQDDMIGQLALLDHYRSNMERFYDLAFKRDNAFLENINKYTKNKDALIIVTGGFHTESLKKLLKEKGYSYVSIMPKLNGDEVSPYLDILSGGMSPFERSISAALSLLQVPDILSDLGIKASDPRIGELMRIKALALQSILGAETPIGFKLTDGQNAILAEQNGIPVCYVSDDPADNVRIVAENVVRGDVDNIMAALDAIAHHREPGQANANPPVPADGYSVTMGSAVKSLSIPFTEEALKSEKENQDKRNRYGGPLVSIFRSMDMPLFERVRTRGFERVPEAGIVERMERTGFEFTDDLVIHKGRLPATGQFSHAVTNRMFQGEGALVTIDVPCDLLLEDEVLILDYDAIKYFNDIKHEMAMRHYEDFNEDVSDEDVAMLLNLSKTFLDPDSEQARALERKVAEVSDGNKKALRSMLREHKTRDEIQRFMAGKQEIILPHDLLNLFISRCRKVPVHDDPDYFEADAPPYMNPMHIEGFWSGVLSKIRARLQTARSGQPVSIWKGAVFEIIALWIREDGIDGYEIVLIDHRISENRGVICNLYMRNPGHITAHINTSLMGIQWGLYPSRESMVRSFRQVAEARDNVLRDEFSKIADIAEQIKDNVEGPSADGPVLFIDTRTAGKAVREFDETEHGVLHDALREMIKDFDMPALDTFDERGVRKLNDTDAARLTGRKDVILQDGRAPPVSVYIIDDAKLKTALPDDYKYLADGLITHAGTWRTDPSGESHANLFISRSVYNTLLSLPETSEDLKLWRQHEIKHLLARTADITPSPEEAAAAKRIGELRSESAGEKGEDAEIKQWKAAATIISTPQGVKDTMRGRVTVNTVNTVWNELTPDEQSQLLSALDISLNKKATYEPTDAEEVFDFPDKGDLEVRSAKVNIDPVFLDGSMGTEYTALYSKGVRFPAVLMKYHGKGSPAEDITVSPEGLISGREVDYSSAPFGGALLGDI